MRKTKQNIGNPALIASAPAIIEKAPALLKAVGDQQRETQKFVIQTARPFLYILGGLSVIIIGKAVLNSQARKKAMQSAESSNAYAVYSIIKSKLPLSIIDIISKPIEILTSVLQPIKALTNKVSELFDTQDKMYNELITIKTNNIPELTQAYKGLFQRNLQEDLFAVLGTENAQKLIKVWEKTDKISNIRNNNYYADGDNNITVVNPESNKQENYHTGWNAELEKVYAITKNKAKIFVVSISNNKMSLIPYTINKNTYIGITAGFKAGTLNIKGGTIFYDKNNNKSLYLYLDNKTLVAPVEDLIFFKTYATFNAYCNKYKTPKAGL